MSDTPRTDAELDAILARGELGSTIVSFARQLERELNQKKGGDATCPAETISQGSPDAPERSSHSGSVEEEGSAK